MEPDHRTSGKPNVILLSGDYDLVSKSLEKLRAATLEH